MSPLIGPSHAFLVILAVSGSLKLLQPTATIDAMLAARIFRPAQRATAAASARVVGIVEAGLAVWALWSGSAYGLASAAMLFVAFNLFLRRLATQDGSASCGCLGMTTSAANPIHRAVNWSAVAVLSAASIAVSSGWSVASAPETMLFDRPTASAYWVAVVVLAWLIAALPTIADLRPPQEVKTV